MPVMVDRSPATNRNGNNMSGDNCGHSGDRLSQNGEKQQVKTATTRVLHGLKNVFFELLRSLCVCIVCVKINNEELFLNAFPFENSYYFISG